MHQKAVIDLRVLRARIAINQKINNKIPSEIPQVSFMPNFINFKAFLLEIFKQKPERRLSTYRDR